MRFSPRRLSVTITLVLLLVSAPLFSQVTWDVCVAEVYSSGSCSNDLGVFTPPTITINQGDMIKFTTRMEMIGGYDGTFHDIQFTGSPATNVTLVISTNVLARWTNVTTPPFNTPGTFAMECVDGNHCFFATDFSGYVCSPYSVTVNSVGCGVTSAFTVSSTTVCEGSTVSFTNASTGADDYQWFIDTTSFSLAVDTSWTFDSAGTYNVMLIASDSDSTCIDTSQSIITVNANPIIDSITSMNTSCNGVCDGSATVYASGGVLPLTYIWSNAFIGNPATNMCVGNYCVTVTDANGCQDTTCVTIGSPAELIVSISSYGNVTCNGVCNGFAQVSVSGGTTPYTYLWSDGQNGNPSLNLCAGTYCVTVTDQNGCSDTACIIISEPAPVVLTTSTINVSCFGACDGSATVVSISGGAGPPYTYLWNDPMFQTTPTATGLCDGIFSVTVTDLNGCIGVTSVVIIQPQLFSMITTSIASTCGLPNGSACVTPIGGTPPYWITWDDPGTTVGTCLSSVGCGTYNPIIVDDNGCLFTMPVIISCISEPSIDSVVTTDVLCFGVCIGSATVYISGFTGPYTFDWKNGGGNTIASSVDTSFIQSIDSLCGDLYSITITDTNGCVSSVGFTINEPLQLVSAIISSSGASCNGFCDGTASVIVANGTPPYSYLWTSGETTSAATALCAGQDTVIITDSNGCTDTNSVAILEPNALVIEDSVVDVLCSGDCDGAIYLTSVTGGTTPYTYSWLPAGCCTSLTNLCTGVYTLILTDMNGCSETRTITVNEPSLLMASGGSTPSSCGDPNGEAFVIASGGYAPYSYLWNDPLAQTNDTAYGLLSGIYDVIITDANGCTFTTTIPVMDGAALLLIDSTSTTDVACNGDASGSASVILASGCEPLTYLWSDVNAQTNATATGLTTGNYTVTVMDSTGQITTGSVVLTQPDSVGLILFNSAFLICYGSSATMDATAFGGTPPYTYIWDNGLDSSASVTVSPLSTTTYLVYALDSNGCVSGSQSVTIMVNPPISPTVNAEDSVCVGDSILISAVASGGNNGPYSYLWSNGITTSSFSLSINSDTSFSVTVSDGCSMDTSVTVNIIVDNCVSVAELSDNELSFAVYPNPSGGEFSLQFRFAPNSALEIQLVDIAGKTVLRDQISPNNAQRKYYFQVENLAKGVYTIQIISSDGIWASPLIIE